MKTKKEIITIYPLKKTAEEIVDLKIELGFAKKEERENLIKLSMKPFKVLIK